jgi:hypothetical protein
MTGLHYSDTLAGRVFSQQTNAVSIAGVAIPIFTGTSVGGGLPLWNPPNSNRNVELVSYDLVYASGTTAATFDGVFLMAGQLTAIGTATGCSVFTSAPPVNGLLLGGASSRVLSSNGGTVTVIAGTSTTAAAAPLTGAGFCGVARTLYSTNVEAATGTAHPTVTCTYTFNGTIIIPSGVLIYLAGIVASTSLYNITMIWKEIPIVPSQG